MTDLALAHRLAQKDTRALSEFYRRFEPMIRAIACRFSSDPRDVEEVLQDVAWTVFRKADTFRGDSDFKGWVHRITQNAARMQHRKRKRAPLPLEDEVLSAVMHRQPDADVDTRPERMWASREAARRMREAFDAMDGLNQQVFEASEFRSMAPTEGALSLDMTVSAFKARLHRVRSQLRTAAVAVM